jgi:hypothetical protein
VPTRARGPGWRAFYSRRGVDRLLESLGSNSNPYPFTLLQGNVNGMKGRVAAGNAAIADDRVARAVRAALGGNDRVAGEIFGYLRQVSAQSSYNTCLMFVN